MHMEDFRQVAKKLEPDAWAGGEGLEPFVISIAVSLKRIADVLEGSTVEGREGKRWLYVMTPSDTV